MPPVLARPPVAALPPVAPAEEPPAPPDPTLCGASPGVVEQANSAAAANKRVGHPNREPDNGINIEILRGSAAAAAVANRNEQPEKMPRPPVRSF
jgi:hypothetical protein